MATASNPCDICRKHQRALDALCELYATNLAGPELRWAYDSLDDEIQSGIEEFWAESAAGSAFIIVRDRLGQADWEQEIADTVDEVVEKNRPVSSITPHLADLRIAETDHRFLHPLEPPLHPAAYSLSLNEPDSGVEHNSSDLPLRETGENKVPIAGGSNTVPPLQPRICNERCISPVDVQNHTAWHEAHGKYIAAHDLDPNAHPHHFGFSLSDSSDEDNPNFRAGSERVKFIGGTNCKDFKSCFKYVEDRWFIHSHVRPPQLPPNALTSDEEDSE